MLCDAGSKTLPLRQAYASCGSRQIYASCFPAYRGWTSLRLAMLGGIAKIQLIPGILAPSIFRSSYAKNGTQSDWATQLSATNLKQTRDSRLINREPRPEQDVHIEGRIVIGHCATSRAEALWKPTRCKALRPLHLVRSTGCYRTKVRIKIKDFRKDAGCRRMAAEYAPVGRKFYDTIWCPLIVGRHEFDRYTTRIGRCSCWFVPFVLRRARRGRHCHFSSCVFPACSEFVALSGECLRKSS